MGKVRQLSNTFQPRQNVISAPTINVNALAPGLAEASSSILAGQQIKMDYQAQKASAQGERASWEMEDWLNRFKLNMNTPEKLRKAFESTPYAGIAAGINADMDIYDSTVAQHIYRQALDVTGKGIDDEDTRNRWMTAKMREWELIEPEYQREADKWVQTEARNTQMQNLNSMFKSGIGTTDEEGRLWNKLTDMRDNGQFGIDAVTSQQAVNDVWLNFQKSEQTALMDQVLRDALMPYALEGASEERLNIVLSGLDLSMEGQNYLTQDEKDQITKRHFNQAKNYSSLYEKKVEEGHTVWRDSEWSEIEFIVAGGDLETGQRIGMAQQKINQMIGSYNTPLNPYDTGVVDMPAVELGTPDGAELKKMIDHLNRFVGQNGNDGIAPEIAAEATIALNNARTDPALGPSTKKNIADQFLRDGLITNSMHTAFYKDTDKYSGDVFQEGYNKALAVSTSLKWDPETESAMITQLTSFYEGAGGLNQGELKIGINGIVNEFADSHTDTSGIIDSWQEETTNFFAGFISTGRNPKVLLQKDFATFQNQIDNGKFAGVVQQEPEMFAEYTTIVGDQLIKGFLNGAIKNIDTAGLLLNENGEPDVVARVVNPYGEAMIAVKVYEDTPGRDAPPGFERDMIKVRVFSANVDKVRGGYNTPSEMTFNELTDNEAYYLSLTDTTGKQIKAPSAGDNIEVGQRTIMGFTGRYTAYGNPILEEQSIDPDFLMRANRGISTN